MYFKARPLGGAGRVKVGSVSVDVDVVVDERWCSIGGQWGRAEMKGIVKRVVRRERRKGVLLICILMLCYVGEMKSDNLANDESIVMDNIKRLYTHQ